MVISNNEKNSDDALEVFTMRFVYGDEPHLEFVEFVSRFYSWKLFF